jgi:membrane fusion protein (multidrug efflux system)
MGLNLGRRNSIPLFVAVLALVAGDANAQDQKAQPPAVTVAKVTTKDVRPGVTFTGRVAAIDKVELLARVSGFLEERLFTEGQEVKKGDRLFVIEKDAYQAGVDEAKGNIQAAEAQLTLANIDVKRDTELVGKNALAQATLDQAIAKVAETEGTLVRLRAALANAELQLSYTEILAPIAGRIGRASFTTGNYVTPSSGVLATIVSQDPIYVNFAVTQREVLAIRERLNAGQKIPDAVVYLNLANGKRYPEPGKLNFVDVSVDSGTDTILVRATFPNKDRLLVDGQLVTVLVEGGEATETLVIPQVAVQADQTGPYVLVVDKDNKIEVRPVELGPMTGTELAVTKGLAVDERIVTEGIQKVRPGQVVDPTEAKTGM